MAPTTTRGARRDGRPALAEAQEDEAGASAAGPGAGTREAGAEGGRKAVVGVEAQRMATPAESRRIAWPAGGGGGRVGERESANCALASAILAE